MSKFSDVLNYSCEKIEQHSIKYIIQGILELRINLTYIIPFLYECNCQKILNIDTIILL